MLRMWCMVILANLAVGLNMTIEEHNIQIDGHTYTRLRMRGHGPEWTMNHGVGYVDITSNEKLNIDYHNHLHNHTIIHGHGLIPDQKYDGVPFVDAKPLAPGESASYSYGVQLERDGTYFLHTHYGLQHTRGLAVPVVIKADAPPNYPNAQLIKSATEVVLFLEDFCDYFPDAGPSQNPKCNNPYTTYESLVEDWNAKAPTYNFSKCDAPADDTDVAFLYQLANGHTIDNPVIVDVKPSQIIRLRVVNSGTMSSYKLKLGEAKGVVIMTDGQWVVPSATKKSVFWIGVAQRLDILIEIPSTGSKAFPIIAQEIGNGLVSYHQSGIVMTIDGAAPGNFSRNASDATGSMDVTQEMSFRAWFPLTKKDVDVLYDVALTGDSGFHSINTRSWQLPPIVPTYTPNPYPLRVKKGQRVCLKIKNHNADAHSMHLHGHSFQVVEIDGQTFSGAMRDTIMTARGKCRTITVCFDANKPGVWPFHCHMSFHLAAGMLTTIEYVE